MHGLLIEFFKAQMDYIYACYGFGFMLLGAVCLYMYDEKRYGLKWRFLGLFAIIHGMSEWMDLLEISLGQQDILIWLDPLFLIVSYVCLVAFGRRNTESEKANLLAAVIYGISLLAITGGGIIWGANGVKNFARYSLCLPGGVWSVWVLYQKAKKNAFPMPYIPSLTVTLAIYTVASGIVVTRGDFFPANVINATTFLNIFSFPIQLIRGLVALAASYFSCAYYFERTFSSYALFQKPRYVLRQVMMFITIGTLLISGWAVTESAGHSVEKNFKRDLLSKAKILAASFSSQDSIDLSAIVNRRDPVMRRKFEARLYAICQAESQFRFVYLMGLQNGKVIFLADGEDYNSPDYSTGDIYEEATPELLDALKTGRAYVEGPEKDRWGTWFTGFAPIYISEEKTIALLGIDINADSFNQMVAHTRFVSIFLILMIAFFALILFTIIVGIQDQSLRIAKNEERLEVALRGSRDGTWEVDMTTGIIHPDDRFCELLGFQSDELLFTLEGWHDRTPPEEWSGIWEEFQKNLTGELDFYSREQRLLTKQKKYRWYLVRGKVSRRDDRGRAIRTAGMISDITDRKTSEESLKQAEQRFRDIVYSSADWVWEVDANGNYTYVSESVKKLLGYSPEELLGKSPFDLMAEDQVLSARSFFGDMLSQKKGFRDFENKNIAKDGREVLLSTSGVPILNAKEEILGYRGVDRDVTERKKFEEEIQLKNAILTAQNDVSIDGILVVSVKGKILSHNQQFLDIWKLPKGFLDQGLDALLLREVIGMTTNPTQFYERIRYLYAHPEETGRDSISLIDGRTLDRYTAPMIAADGHYIGRVWYYRDVTESKHLEDELWHAWQQLSSIIEFLPDATFVVDAERKVIAWNKAIEEMTGVRKTDILGKGDLAYSLPFYGEKRKILVDLVLDDSGNTQYSAYEQRGKIIYGESYCAKLYGGKGAYCWGTASKLYDSQGRVAGAIESIRDISERKRAAEDLDRVRQQFSDIIEFLPDATFVIDKEKKVIAWNRAMEELTGTKKKDVLGKSEESYSIIIYGKRRPVLIDLVMNMPEDTSGLYLSLEKRGECLFGESFIPAVKGGKGMICWGTATKLYDQKGNVCGAIESVRDVTDRKQLENDLRQAQRDADSANTAKSEFLANMSHEIITPMNAIIGFSNLLSKSSLTETQRHYVDVVCESGRLLLNLLGDVLDISKIEAKTIKLEHIHFDFEYLVSSVIQIVRPRLRGKQIEISYSFEPGMPKFYQGDPTRIRQILINLLSNAVKFTNQGSISVALTTVFPPSQESKERMIQVAVKDTGIGIARDKQKEIFDAFVQADSSISRRYGGSGLGLAIVKSLIEKMGGDIWLDSHEGAGSIFTFTLRLQEGRPVTEENIFLVPLSELKGKKVLIVDEDMSNRELLKKLIEETKLELLADITSSELGAWLKDARELPNLLFCGSESREDAVFYTRLLKQDPRYQKIKLIAIAGDVRPGSTQIYQQTGFDGYLAKPVDRTEFVRIVQTLLGDFREKPTLITHHDAEELKLKGLKVLVVEDNPINVELALIILKALACETDTASNGLEAIKKVKETPYDVILMDIQMPELDGIEATNVIRKQLGLTLPIIGLTAVVLRNESEQALAAGMNELLRKPLDELRLKAALFHWGRRLEVEPKETAEKGKEPSSEQTPSAAPAGIPQNVYDRLIKVFDSQLADRLPKIKEALELGDLAQVKSLAHALRGAALNLEILDAAQVLEAIEKAAKEGAAQDVIRPKVDKLFEIAEKRKPSF